MLYQDVSLENEKTKWQSNLLERGYGWRVRGLLPFNATKVVGVDPGVNFGMTMIDGTEILCYHGKLKTNPSKLEYAVMAHALITNMIDDGLMTNAHFVLEGAAFNKTFGQVQLAEVRTGFYMGMRHFDLVEVIAPMSVRKQVFGDGRTQPMDIWPTLNHNAADSLSIALVGI